MPRFLPILVAVFYRGFPTKLPFYFRLFWHCTRSNLSFSRYYESFKVARPCPLLPLQKEHPFLPGRFQYSQPLWTRPSNLPTGMPFPTVCLSQRYARPKVWIRYWAAADITVCRKLEGMSTHIVKKTTSSIVVVRLRMMMMIILN